MFLRLWNEEVYYGRGVPFVSDVLVYGQQGFLLVLRLSLLFFFSPVLPRRDLSVHNRSLYCATLSPRVLAL